MYIDESLAVTLLTSKVETKVKNNKRSATGAYLTLKEKKDIQIRLGEPAYILYDYLLDMTKFRNPDITINGLMDVTGWTISKTRRTRTLLVKAELLHEVYLSNASGHKLTVCYLGEEAVQVAKEYEAEYVRNKLSNKLDNVMEIVR